MNQSIGKAPNILFDRCRFLWAGFAIEFLGNCNNVIFTRCRMFYGVAVTNNLDPMGFGIGWITQNCILISTLCSYLQNAVVTNNTGYYIPYK